MYIGRFQYNSKLNYVNNYHVARNGIRRIFESRQINSWRSLLRALSSVFSRRQDGKKYWLFKTEPDCFSIDDLAGLPGQTDHWDGVRNYQARNMLRDDIKKGDRVFFYNSSCKLTGIAGICEVIKSGYPDFTAMEPEGQHYDPKASAANPIWYMVDIKLAEKFPQIIPLSGLKKTAGLEEMVLTQKGSRLSIQPVSPREWKIITKLSSAGR